MGKPDADQGIGKLLKRIGDGADLLDVVKDDGEVALPGAVSALLSQVRARVEAGELDEATKVELSGRVVSILRDMNALPLKPGDARPEDKDITDVDELVEEPVLKNLAQKLFAMIQESATKNSASDYYNAFRTYDPARLEVIWEQLNDSEKIKAMIDRIAELLMPSIQSENANEEALSDIKSALGGGPTRFLSAKNPAYILMHRLKHLLAKEFVTHLVTEVENHDLPLVEGQEPAENIESLRRGLRLAESFQDMDQFAYLDMLKNPLGQAQTADPNKAESFFRTREGIAEQEIDNNFGYVYLTKEQATEFGVHSEDSAVREFRYFDQEYVAVPVGLYFSKRADDKFTQAMADLKEMAAEAPGTPIQDYFDCLRAYYEFPIDTDQRGDDFVKEYYDLCYKAEKLWVAYVRYAAENNLPFIMIHPFEKYSTTSTKSHDLALGTLNHAETAVYLEAKARFIANLEGFFDRTGLKAQHPKMVNETMRLVNSAAILSLGARFGSIIKGTIAQNIPNEEPGRADGIVTLCDTAFAMEAIASSHGKQMEMADALGGLFEQHRTVVRDRDLFMLHYILEVVSHELNHNSYKGREQSYAGTESGLAIKMIEEAKATNGLAFAFEDPYNLSDDEIGKLRDALPIMLPWSIFRFKKELRAQHSSHQYLREGAVMIDHALKSGLLEVVHVEITDDGEAVTSEDYDSERGFEFLRYNFADSCIKDYIARCAQFMKRLAPDYSKTQGFEGRLNGNAVVEDWDDIDAWQAVSIECHKEEIAEKEAELGEQDPDVLSLRNSLEALTPPQNAKIAGQVRALIRNANYSQPGRMEAEVARAYELPPGSSELSAKVQALKAQLKERYPQIRS